MDTLIRWLSYSLTPTEIAVWGVFALCLAYAAGSGVGKAMNSLLVRSRRRKAERVALARLEADRVSARVVCGPTRCPGLIEFPRRVPAGRCSVLAEAIRKRQGGRS
jgi:hypothetical protein